MARIRVSVVFGLFVWIEVLLVVWSLGVGVGRLAMELSWGGAVWEGTCDYYPTGFKSTSSILAVVFLGSGV